MQLRIGRSIAAASTASLPTEPEASSARRAGSIRRSPSLGQPDDRFGSRVVVLVGETFDEGLPKFRRIGRRPASPTRRSTNPAHRRPGPSSMRRVSRGLVGLHAPSRRRRRRSERRRPRGPGIEMPARWPRVASGGTGRSGWPAGRRDPARFPASGGACGGPPRESRAIRDAELPEDVRADPTLEPRRSSRQSRMARSRISRLPRQCRATDGVPVEILVGLAHRRGHQLVHRARIISRIGRQTPMLQFVNHAGRPPSASATRPPRPPGRSAGTGRHSRTARRCPRPSPGTPAGSTRSGGRDAGTARPRRSPRSRCTPGWASSARPSPAGRTRRATRSKAESRGGSRCSTTSTTAAASKPSSRRSR